MGREDATFDESADQTNEGREFDLQSASWLSSDNVKKMMEMMTTMPSPLPKGRVASTNVKRQ